MTRALVLAALVTACSQPKAPEPLLRDTYGMSWWIDATSCLKPIAYASPEYIQFCIAEPQRLANHDQFPACHDVMFPLKVGEQYFEVLDCSWHAGKNPRP